MRRGLGQSWEWRRANQHGPSRVKRWTGGKPLTPSCRAESGLSVSRACRIVGTRKRCERVQGEVPGAHPRPVWLGVSSSAPPLSATRALSQDSQFKVDSFKYKYTQLARGTAAAQIETPPATGDPPLSSSRRTNPSVPSHLLSRPLPPSARSRTRRAWESHSSSPSP